MTNTVTLDEPEVVDGRLSIDGGSTEGEDAASKLDYYRIEQGDRPAAGNAPNSRFRLSTVHVVGIDPDASRVVFVVAYLVLAVILARGLLR